ncbi:MAG: CDP-2,3-bis-(O-geranylgeranyl)-sn-glycerol synthase [Thermoplasmatota archaeon]
MAWVAIPHALWLFLPAYVANMSPVVTARMLPRWNAPMDGGRLAADGRRVLGAGKTWRGLAGGTLGGAVTALLCAAVAPHWGWLAGWDFGAQGCLSCHAAAIFLFGAMVGAFALAGDAVKSYFKRRRGREGGAPWVPFDQLDFVVFGVVGMFVASPLLAHGWVWHAFTDDWLVPVTLLVLTPFLHLAVNGLGFLLRLKKVPW